MTTTPDNEISGPPGADTARPDCVDGPGGQSLPSAETPPQAASNGPQRGSFSVIRSGPFKGLLRDAYGFISADPAWDFRTYSKKGHGKSAQAHYDCMTLDEIKALPVAQIAADNCMLMLWATNPMLPQAIEVLRAWGFTYATAGTWVKRTKGGKLAFGTGYRLRSANEPFLIGTIGNPKNTRATRTVIEGVVREHSRKPDEAFAAAEELMPGVRRVELFSRQRRPGWDCWGNQTTHFKEIAA